MPGGAPRQPFVMSPSWSPKQASGMLKSRFAGFAQPAGCAKRIAQLKIAVAEIWRDAHRRLQQAQNPRSVACLVCGASRLVVHQRVTSKCKFEAVERLDDIRRAQSACTGERIAATHRCDAASGHFG